MDERILVLHSQKMRVQMVFTGIQRLTEILYKLLQPLHPLHGLTHTGAGVGHRVMEVIYCRHHIMRRYSKEYSS